MSHGPDTALFQLGVLGVQVDFRVLSLVTVIWPIVVIDVADGDDIPALLVELGMSPESNLRTPWRTLTSPS